VKGMEAVGTKRPAILEYNCRVSVGLYTGSFEVISEHDNWAARSAGNVAGTLHSVNAGETYGNIVRALRVSRTSR
jgi:hypothetical protein